MKNILKIILRKLGYEIRKVPKGELLKEKGDLQKIFSYIYEYNVWGGNRGEFYSGPGSNDNVSEPYVQLIRKFIYEKNIKVVVDIGCGDFRVGQRIVNNNIKYYGIDIVPSLIKRNNKFFSSENVKFICANAIKDDLPAGDLCLIRQVLQHLSNQDIMKILEKCRIYKYVIVTEHIPADKDAVPNLDMGPDWDIRLKKNSGVYLDKPPFNYKTLTLLDVDPEHKGFSNSIIRTSLIVNNHDS
jgi:SAM-dependent methyltransferase